MANTTKLRRGRPAMVLNASTPAVVPGRIRGVLTPGVPVSLAELGLTTREADRLIEDGLPLSLTRVGPDAPKED